MNFLIVNQPLGNRGDESAHKALVKSLNEKLPDARIKILFINGDLDSINQFKVENANNEYINIPNTLGAWKTLRFATAHKIHTLWKFHPTTNRILKIIRSSDIVICAPGGICMGGFQNWNHVSVLYMAKYLRKKIAYYGRSFGPFPTQTRNNRLFKKRSYELLHYFSFLSIRDAETEKLANAINLNYISTIDTAFLDLPNTEIDSKIAEQIGDSYTVFVPNSLRWHFKFKSIDEDTIFSFYMKVVELIKKHRPADRIILLPQTFNSQIGELELFNRISQNTTNVVVMSDQLSSDTQQTIISKAHAVIGARYHSVVFAINQNVPFIALSYEHKIAGLLQRLNKNNCMVNIEDIFDSPKKIEACINSIDTIYSSISSDSEAQNSAKTIANSCLNKLVEFISGKKTL